MRCLPVASSAAATLGRGPPSHVGGHGLCITYLSCATESEAHRFLQDEKESEPMSTAMPTVSELPKGSREDSTQSSGLSTWDNKTTICQLPSISRQPLLLSYGIPHNFGS